MKMKKPENGSFSDTIDFALLLKVHLEQFGYHAFVKTTGKNGLHILTPIQPQGNISEVYTAASGLTSSFVAAHPKIATLHVRKEARKAKSFLDIYQNRSAQTIVSPYSLRGIAQAPVSMPLAWEGLSELKRPDELNIHTVPKILAREGDAWEALPAYAVPLQAKEENRS